MQPGLTHGPVGKPLLSHKQLTQGVSGAVYCRPGMHTSEGKFRNICLLSINPGKSSKTERNICLLSYNPGNNLKTLTIFQWFTFIITTCSWCKSQNCSSRTLRTETGNSHTHVSVATVITTQTSSTWITLYRGIDSWHTF